MKAFEFAGEVERIVDPDSLADFADGEVGRFQQLRRQRVSDGLEIVVRRNSDDLPEPPGEGVGGESIPFRQLGVAPGVSGIFTQIAAGAADSGVPYGKTQDAGRQAVERQRYD